MITHSSMPLGSDSLSLSIPFRMRQFRPVRAKKKRGQHKELRSADYATVSGAENASRLLLRTIFTTIKMLVTSPQRRPLIFLIEIETECVPFLIQYALNYFVKIVHSVWF